MRVGKPMEENTLQEKGQHNETDLENGLLEFHLLE